MAEKSFGAKKIKLDGSGTPTIQSPGTLNLNAVTVGVSTNLTAGGTVTAATFSGSGASLTNLPGANLTGTVNVARLGSGASNTKFLRGDNTWQTVSTSGTPEGTAILSTGESGGTKFLREDGDGTCSWQTVSASAEGISTNANFSSNGGTNTGLSSAGTLIFGTSIGQKFGYWNWGSNQNVYLRTSNSSSYNYGTLKIRSDRGQTGGAQPIYASDSGASIMMAQYDGDVMLCSQTGNFNIGESTGGSTNTGWHFDVSGMAKCCVDSGSSNPNCKMYRQATGDAIQFIDRASSSDVEIGSITIDVSSNSTAYNTSSDYRIKENVVNITGALAKINQLRPVNFNFIGKSVKLDGFLAHEVQAIVPYAVTGDKDAVKTVKDGDLSNDGSESDYVRIAALSTKEVPSLQQMDNSKLIGLLTAAVQELSAKNDALEARIAALES